MIRLFWTVLFAAVAMFAFFGVAAGYERWQEPWPVPSVPVPSPGSEVGGVEGAPPGGWEPAPCSHRRPVGECALDGGAE